jgi:hypothetical protein
MAHFAQLDSNNTVIQVIVVNNNELLDENGNEIEQKGIDFCHNLFGGRWIQTSYNCNFRKHYAGIGFRYDTERDLFIPPQPYLSWTLNNDTLLWDPPVPYPTNGKKYAWFEPNKEWIELNVTN